MCSNSMQGLTWFREGNEKRVRFSHYSVKEYLVSPRILQGKGVAPDFAVCDTVANQLFARVSLIYLLSVIQSTAATSDPFPLLQYAAKFWPKHCHASTVEERQKLEHSLMKKLFDPTSNIRLNWLRVYDPDVPYRSVSNQSHTFPPPLYYSSLLSFGGVTEWLLKIGANANAQGGLYSNALQAASSNGNEALVRLLLERGAKVDAEG